MSDRRFNEEEVAANFQQATEALPAPQRQLPSGEGLTLAEIQEISGRLPLGLTRLPSQDSRDAEVRAS